LFAMPVTNFVVLPPAPQLDFEHPGVCGSSVTVDRLFSERYNRLHLISPRLHFRNRFTL
jgi:hypothetical protein